MEESGLTRPTFPKKITLPVVSSEIPPKPLTSFWKVISTKLDVETVFFAINLGVPERPTGPAKLIPPTVVDISPEIEEIPAPVC